MNKRIIFYLLFFLIIAITSCNNQKTGKISEWDDKLSVEQNITKNAVPFQTNDEFPFLDEIAKTKSVIILGEQTHFEYVTSETKIKMLLYLKKKGIKTIALEGVSFLTGYMFSNPEYVEVTKNWKIEDFWGYTGDKKHLDLMEMINNREFEVLGIDIHPNIYDISSAQAILDKYDDLKPDNINWFRLKEIYTKYHTGSYFFSYSFEKFEEKDELMEIIRTIYNYTEYIISVKGEFTDLSAIKQWIRSIKAAFVYRKYYPAFVGDSAETKLRARDNQMAENIVWLYQHNPRKKMTVWCANWHGSKSLFQTQDRQDPQMYYYIQTMGEGVYDKLGDKLYSLAFTALNFPDYSGVGIFEKEIAAMKENPPFAFIDFQNLRYQKDYKYREFDSSVFGRRKGIWMHVFDGVYYIREQKYNFDAIEKDTP